MFKNPKIVSFVRLGRAATRGRETASDPPPPPLNYQLLENSTCGDDVNESRVSYTSGDGRARVQVVHA